MDGSIRYAKNGDIHLAYRVVGEGPIDLMFVPTWTSNLDLLEEYPPASRWLDRMASFTRLITFDRRGTGLSDRTCGVATLEEGMDDMLAVMDAVGCERVALAGFNESGTLCSLVAATHPDRVSSLVLYGSFATTLRADDYPWAPTPEERDLQVEFIVREWGTEDWAVMMNPTDAADATFRRFAARWMRGSISPDALRPAFEILGKTDVRHVLPTIRVPTLILHRTDDVVVPVENSRYIASKIPNSRLVEFEGSDHLFFFGDWDPIADEIEEFLTGTRRKRDHDRVLATILFTDIVGSSEKALELGDRRWKELLDEHDRIVASEIDRFDGTLVKNIGDGALARFDGPARAIRAACRIRSKMHEIGLETRSGLHTGEVEVRGEDLGGIAVHIGARVTDEAGAGEVYVSSAVPPLVAGSGIDFEDLGARALKGVEGEWRLYRVRD